MTNDQLMAQQGQGSGQGGKVVVKAVKAAADCPVCEKTSLRKHQGPTPYANPDALGATPGEFF